MILPELYSNVLEIPRGNLTITDVGQDYGLSVHKMTNLLLKTGIIRKTGNNYDMYHLSDTSLGVYYGFSLIENRYVNDTTGKLPRYTIKFNKKGLNKIYDQMKTIGIKPICELLLEVTSDNVPKTKYSLYKRRVNGHDVIYLGYTHMRNSDDKIGLNFQPVNDLSAKIISRMMKNSIRWAEDSNRSNCFKKPRIDDRDKNYSIINNFMYDRFIKSINISKETGKVININNELYNDIMEV